MDPTQHPLKTPIELRPTWYDRIAHWSGWEKMVEYRAQFIGGTLCFVALVWLIGWWFASSESSSMAHALRAEAIVQRLQAPGSTPDTSEPAVGQDLQRLVDLAPLGSPISTRFSGVIAEEEILQHVHPLTQARFDIAAQNLVQATLPIDASIPKATFLSKQGNGDDAIRVLDEMITSSAGEGGGQPFPEVHAYALLQKIALLRAQHKPNGAVIDELRLYLSSTPDVEASFNHWLSGKSSQFLSFLRVEA